ncbi:MAG: SAM-dependent DNA methyltransferase, partial [Chlorobiota bacterium]
YMLTNPPFGVSWKKDAEFVKDEARDSRGRFFAGIPKISDGSLLFLQHMISKMEAKGSRIGIIFNGSPLFNGDAGSGESEIRKWIIENDMLECIVQLPDSLFFNTDITTYIWIVTNKKSPYRRGHIQLINAANHYQPMKKSLGKKRKEVTAEQIDLIVKTYNDFTETEICKIYPNSFFGYVKVTVERPLIENGQPVFDKKGALKPDSSLRDFERVPLDTPVEEYFEKEVKPHQPDAWMDRAKDVRGYEINFTKYFYKFMPLRPLEEITKELQELEKKSDNLMKELIK